MVYQTQFSIVPDDREFCQQVARIYDRLYERRVQMQQLTRPVVYIFLNFVSRFFVIFQEKPRR